MKGERAWCLPSQDEQRGASGAGEGLKVAPGRQPMASAGECIVWIDCVCSSVPSLCNTRPGWAPDYLPKPKARGREEAGLVSEMPPAGVTRERKEMPKEPWQCTVGDLDGDEGLCFWLLRLSFRSYTSARHSLVSQLLGGRMVI